MQTIYTFSYNPAIATGTKTIGTQWRMAYQAPINLYKGIPNTIKIVIFTSNQKVVDLSDYDVQVQIVDKETETHLVTRTAENTTPETGIVTVTFTEQDLRYLNHRFYHLIARLIPVGDDSTITEGEILYLDDNYGVFTPLVIENAWNFSPTSISTVDGLPEITFTNIGETPDSYTGNAGKYLKVNNSETGLMFTTISYNDLTDIPTPSYNDLTDKPFIPNLLATGDIIPSANVTYSLGNATNQWQDLWVSNSTIFIGGVALTVDNSGNLLVDGNVITGGGASPIQPYIELTNYPFIIQPAILGEPVTVTAAQQGSNARFTVVISEGPIIDSITITTAGSGYTVGQRYRLWSYYIGGPNDVSSIDFEVATVGENGELLTITDANFVGAASNNPGTYTNASAELRASVFDEIGPGLILTRDRVQGIYNSSLEQEYDNNNYLSPLGTEWNSDGWETLTGISLRDFTTWRSALNNAVGNNILGSELVMHDIANDKYYKFDFTQWGGSNGGYSYTRREITDPNYFKKTDYGNEVDVIEDDSTVQIGITRGNNNGIYNPFTEEGWDSDVSPQGTLWNIDGWNDLTDLTSRTYTNLYAAFDGNLGNKIVGTECVMYVPSIEKYYAIKFLSWTQGGNGGGFSYVRYEIDQTKLNEGIRFADGSILKSAEGIGRVKSTASGNRRIEEVSGSNIVSVTAKTTVNLTSVASRSVVNDSRFWVANATTTIDEIVNSPSDYDITDYSTIQFSLDNTTWFTYTSGYSGTGTEIGVDTNGSHTYNQGDTIYFRYATGGAPQVWWNKNDLPGGSADFRGAVIDYHAYSGQATWIGTIHIVDDSGEEHITHTEVMSGTSDAENDDLWVVENEGTISYRRIDGEARTLKVHWTAKVFYGSEYYD